jgi:hypothetical protein
MDAEFARPQQRYGAEAAEALLCSIDHLVDEMPGHFGRARLEPWPKDEKLPGGDW